MPRLAAWALGLVLLAASPATALAGPLVGQWHLDGKIDLGDGYSMTPDSSGNGIDATTGSVSEVPGRFSTAFAFTQNSLMEADSPLLRPERLTALAWVRRAGTPGNSRYVLAQGSGACVPAAYGMYTSYAGGPNEGGLYFYVNHGGSPYHAPGLAAGDVWDGAWHMVAGTFDGTTVRFYLDGTEVGSGLSAPGAIDYAQEQQRFRVGRYGARDTEPCSPAVTSFDGNIDEVQVYDRALSSGEVARLAAAPGPDPPVLQPDVPEPSFTPGGPGPGGEAGPGPAHTAPRVIDIAPVEEFQTGRAAVVTATVEGSAESLHWNLSGDGRPEIVSTAAQSSLRFRPPPGPFTIEVRAIGPGGAGPALSRSFTGPPAVRGTSAGLNRLIVRADKVLAAGPRNALVKSEVGAGQACLSESVMRSGGLEIEGCFEPIERIDDIPAAERGILDTLARGLGMNGGLRATALNTALGLTDAYKVRGTATINGVTMTPEAGATIVVYPQVNGIVSANARLKIGPLALGARKNFKIDTRLAAGAIPLGTFPRLRGLPDIGKLKLAGDVDVKLVPPDGATPAEARITVNLRLPEFLKIGGVKLESQVQLRATAREGLVLQNLRIGPLDAKVGGLDLKAFQVSHDGGDEWRGQGKACVVKGTCLDMIPPNGGVTIKDGGLGSLGATLAFPPPGIPLFAGVTLDQIGFRFSLDPTRLSGNARITAAKIYAIDGRLLVAFPSEAAPFVFSRDDVGAGYPAGFYGRRHTRATVAASAAASLKVPVLGDIRLGDSYFLYEFPGYVAFGGSTHQGFAGVVSMDGSLNGEFNVENGRFNVMGRVSACLISVLCRGANGLISSHGLSACLEVGPFNIGGGVVYSPFDIRIWPLDGCKWSPFAERNVRPGRAVAAQAAGTHVIEIKAGDPSRAIELAGAAAAPRIRVTTPDGKAVESSPESGFVNEGAIRIIRSEPTKLTVVGLQDPPPGVYRIDPLEGSPAVATISEAEDQPDAKLTASVRSRGAQRVLSYDISERRAQRVTFSEVGNDGGSRSIGTVDGGGSGTLAFTPAPSTGTRRVEAQFELDGLPAERLVVARFSPPSPTLPRVQRLKVRRQGTALIVRWRRVAGASAYELVTTPSTGPSKLLRTRRPRATVRGIPRYAAGRVTVRAVAHLREGRPASARFRRTGPRPSRLRALARCRGRAIIVCAR